MSSYCQREQAFGLLRSVLHDSLTEISDDQTLNLEINPAKIAEGNKELNPELNLSPEHPLVQKEVSARTTKLRQIAHDLFEKASKEDDE